MKKQLFIYSFLIIFTGLAVFFAASVYITHTNNFYIAKDEVIKIAQIYAEHYNDKVDVTTFVKSGGNTRITVISRDGTVLADSRPVDTKTMENHLDRPEIQSALNDTPEIEVRYSDTLGVDLIYYALKVYADDTYLFVRVSVPVAEINAYLYSTLPLLVLILIILVTLSFIFIRHMTNRIEKPFTSIEHKLRLLSGGEYKDTPIEGSYEEIDRLTRGIDEIADVLQNTFDLLSDEKNKLDYILDNIGDGIFTVDENRTITLINKSALDIFDVTLEVIGKDIVYLSSEESLIEAVNDCVKYKKSSILEIEYIGKIFLVTVKRLPDTNLTMIVLSDVTENRKNAKRREEFFANASHELKTPMTAIKGFNELASLNNSDEQLRKYIDSITRETDRMLLLIGNMLKLAELENVQEITPVPVSISNIVYDVKDTVSTIINEKSLSFEVIGNGTTITAKHTHVYELVKNLIENAVRYNNPNGKVSVRIDDTRIVVSDNGIGIPVEDQSRIFERFYRVEKSRNGGTGLGLSIAKHICGLYNWKITLKSRVGSGTEITVNFG